MESVKRFEIKGVVVLISFVLEKLLLSNIWSSGDYQTATAFTNFAN